MPGGQGDFVQHRAVPAMEEDAAAAGILDDGVQALAQLVYRLVEQDFFHALVLQRGDDGKTLGPGRVDLRGVGGIDQLVGRPFSPLHAIHRAQVIGAGAERIGQPVSVFVGILVPDLAAQRAEIGRAAGSAQEAAQFAHHRLEGQALGGHRRKTLLQVEAHHGAGNAQGADAGAVVLPGAIGEHVLDEVLVLFHCNVREAGREAEGWGIVAYRRPEHLLPQQLVMAAIRRKTPEVLTRSGVIDGTAPASETDVLPALELQHLARLVRGGHLQGKRLDHGADTAHLVGIALGQLAGAIPE